MTALTKEQRKAWNTLKDPYVDKTLTSDAAVVRELEYIRKTAEYTNRMGQFLLDVATNRANTRKYKGYLFKEDMVHDAVLVMMMSLKKFDTSKHSNIRAYLRQCCESALIRFVNKENKQYHIKNDILEQIQQGIYEA